MIEFYDVVNSLLGSSTFIWSHKLSEFVQNTYFVELSIKINLINVSEGFSLYVFLVNPEFEEDYVFLDNIHLRPLQCQYLGDGVWFLFYSLRKVLWLHSWGKLDSVWLYIPIRRRQGKDLFHGDHFIRMRSGIFWFSGLLPAIGD